jgi:hypothetical protein
MGEKMSGPWEKYGKRPSQGEGPWSKFQAKESTQGQAALEGFGRGASLGYLPQLQAGVERISDGTGHLKDMALDAVGLDDLASSDYQLEKQGFEIPQNSYLEARDSNIRRQKKQKADNPITAGASELAGSVVTGIATSGLMPGAAAKTTAETAKAAKNLGFAARIGKGIKTGAQTGAIYGAAANPGDVEGEISPIQLKERAINTALGTVLGAGTGAVVGTGVETIKGGSGLVKKGAGIASDKLKSFGNKALKNATGATGKQASEFADDAGIQLYERGLVKFGDSQEKIAQRVVKAVESANSQIDDALAKLEKNGVKVDRNQIYGKLREKINKLKGDESQADIARILENELDNVVNAAEASGTTEIGIAAAEKIKRGYNRKAGNWADPEKSQAGKEMYQTYRRSVEDAAKAADPKTAALFEEGKKTYGLLAPIEEAASRRAATTAQSPAGGFLDVTTALGGFATGNPAAGIAAPIARRMIAPRISSSVGVTAMKMASGLRKIPQIAELEAKNPAAFQSFVNTLVNGQKGGASTPKAAEEKPKGEKKWADDGLKKLLDHTKDPGQKKTIERARNVMLQNPKLKQLLIYASDLKPGSPAMEKVLEQIKKEQGRDLATGVE